MNQNIVRSYIRSVIQEGDYKKVLGGIREPIVGAEPIIQAPVKQGSVGEVLMQVVAASDALLAAHKTIIDDVNQAIVDYGEIGAYTSSSDNKRRALQYASLLDADRGDIAISALNYPFRTALFAIAVANGIQYFGQAELRDPAEIEKIRVALDGAKARSAEAQAREAEAQAPKQESKNRNKLSLKILLEADPATAVVGHAALEATEAVLEKAIGVTLAKEYTEMKAPEIIRARAVANEVSKWDDIFDIPNSPITPGDADTLGGRLWLKNTFGARALEWWNNVAPAKIKSVIEGLKLAAGQAGKALESSGLPSPGDFEIREAIRAFMVKYLAAQDVAPKGLTGMFNAMISDVSGLGGTNPAFERLRAIARAATSQSPSFSGTHINVPGVGDVPVTEAAQAVAFFKDVVGATAQLVTVFSNRGPVSLGWKRFGKPLFVSALALGLGYHAADWAFSDVKTAPEDIDPETLATILKSARIRRAATEAQKTILLDVSLPNTALEQADEAMLYAFQSTDSYDVNPDQLDRISTLYRTFAGI